MASRTTVHAVTTSGALFTANRQVHSIHVELTGASATGTFGIYQGTGTSSTATAAAPGSGSGTVVRSTRMTTAVPSRRFAWDGGVTFVNGLFVEISGTSCTVLVETG